MKFKSWILTCLVMCLLAGPAFARHGDGEHKEHGKNGEKGGMMGMGLTDAQKEKMKAIKEERKQAAQAHKEKIKAFHQSLKELLKNEKPDDGAIKKILADIKSERANSLKAMEAVQAKMEALLTPVQLARMELRHGKGKWKGKKGDRDEHGRGGERRERRKHHEDDDE